MIVDKESFDFLVCEEKYTDEELSYYREVEAIYKGGYQNLYRVKASNCTVLDVFYSEKDKRYYTYVITKNNYMILVMI